MGPALLDLAAQTGSDIQSIGSIFAFRAFGYLSGSSIGGYLYEKINGNYLLSVATCICMIGISLYLFLRVCQYYVFPYCYKVLQWLSDRW